MVKKLHEAKVHLVVGTDNINGLMMHHEMDLYVRAGISPADTLRMATIEAARAVGQERRFGSIAKGKRADLVVLDGDPLADIRAVARVVTTMRGGVVFPSEPLYRSAGVRQLPSR